MLALNIQSLKYFQLKTVNIIAYMTVSVTFTKKKVCTLFEMKDLCHLNGRHKLMTLKDF